jgi:phosphatidylethanolamine/phosphatidyl-N-methylethanolamine N-methyltransferase
MGRALPFPPFLVDQGRFLLRILRNPRNVGAVAPSSAALARAMAAQIPDGDGPVLELGPGTGAITEAIIARGVAAERLTAIEFDADFAVLVQRRFPRAKVLRGDAFDLARTLGSAAPFSAILSGLPLLNFPPERRASLLAQIFAALAPGAPFIQFSYGLKPPVSAPQGARVVRAAFIPFNLPPARVWVYRQSR